MQDYIDRQIDRYKVTEHLGMGGMALVYKAYDMRLERDVAIKLIRTEAIPAEQYDRLMKRFEREAKAQARFIHRHIVPVFDYGEVDGSPYLVMAYIPGGTLKERSGIPIPYQQAIRWLVPVADALCYAHKRGVIHRDIKPSNILFDDEEQPILTDFGIAKILDSNEATLTGTGLGVGTPEYMAPEQWQGKVTNATDQYALSIVLYELITGVKPYEADTPAGVAIMQATEPLKLPKKIVTDIPDEVENFLIKSLSKDPRTRYIDMKAFQKELEKQVVDSNSETLTVNYDLEDTQMLKDYFESATYDTLDLTPGKEQNLIFQEETESSRIGEMKQTIFGRWVLWLLRFILIFFFFLLVFNLLWGLK